MRLIPMICLAATLTGGNLAMAAELPSPLPVTRDNPSEDFVRGGLQALGYSDVRDLRCSGNVCDAMAVWQGAIHDLRIETDTGRIQSAFADSEALAIGTTHDPDEEYVRQQLEAMHFTDVKNVRRSGAIFDAEAKLDGKPVNLRIDSRSGEVTREGGDDVLNIPVRADMDADYVRRKLQWIGFTDVGDVRRDGGVYHASAQRYGEPVEVTVESDTGRVEDE